MRGERIKAILGSPITWAPFLPVMGAWAILGVPPIIALGLAAAVGCGLWTYWKGKRKEIDTKVISQLVEKSNAEQDRDLIERCNQLARIGYRDYGVTLASFLRRKQQIEKSLHADSKDGVAVSAEKEHVETLVDSLCFGVAEELERLATLQGDQKKKRKGTRSKGRGKEGVAKASAEIAKRIQKAYDTLEQTWEGLEELLNPAVGLDGGDRNDENRLDNVIAKLEEERAISKRVRERMKEELGQLPGSLDEPSLGGDEGRERGRDELE